MIRCEHFIYALFNNIGYKLIKTGNLKKILSDENLQSLCHIGDGFTQEAYIQLWFPTEKLITVSYIHPTRDEYGRQGVWNHTIIIPINDYLQLSQPATIFNPYFIRNLKEPPKTLAPITLKEMNQNET